MDRRGALRRLRINQAGMTLSSICFYPLSHTCDGTVFFDETEQSGARLII